MSEMKPVEMWAVYNAAGVLMRWSLAPRRAEAIQEYLSESVHAIAGQMSWPKICRYYGYTCRKVRVSVVE